MIKKEILEQAYKDVEKRSRKMAVKSGMRREIIWLSFLYILTLVLSTLAITYTTKAIPILFLIMWKLDAMFKARISLLNVRYTKIANQKIKESLKEELRKGGYIH